MFPVIGRVKEVLYDDIADVGLMIRAVPQFMIEALAVIAAFSSVRRMTLNYICSIEVF